MEDGTIRARVIRWVVVSVVLQFLALLAAASVAALGFAIGGHWMTWRQIVILALEGQAGILGAQLLRWAVGRVRRHRSLHSPDAA